MKPVPDDRFHARLAKGAARLLVGKDILERHHFGGKLGQVRLSGIDDGEALMQLAERSMGALGLVGKPAAEPVADMIEAFIKCAGELRLA